MKRTLKALALAGTVAIPALMGGIGAAEAGKKGFHHHHHWKPHHHHHHYGRHFSGYHHGCGFYKIRWHKTGSFYWKKRYFNCKGWW